MSGLLLVHGTREEQERADREQERVDRERPREHERHLLEERGRQELALAKANRSTAINQSGRQSETSPKLPHFDDKKDNMDAYLHRFEDYAVVQGWAEDKWAVNPSALLKGNALETYYRMDTEDHKDYKKLKAALLRRFGLTESGFRSKFRHSKPDDQESFGQYVTRLSGYFDRWIELGSIEKHFDNLRNLIITEQVLNMCSKRLRLFIKERGPKTMADMTSVAEHCLEVHGKLYSHWSNRNDRGHGKGQGQTPSSSKSQFQGKVKGSEYRARAPKTSGKSCFVCSSTSHLARDCPQKSSKGAPPRSGGVVDGGKGPRTGFAVKELPGSVQLKTDDGEILTLTVGEDGMYTRQAGTGPTMKLSFTATRVENLPVTIGRVKGQDDIEVLRDTGCMGVVVKKSLCSDNDFTG